LGKNNLATLNFLGQILTHLMAVASLNCYAAGIFQAPVDKPWHLVPNLRISFGRKVVRILFKISGYFLM
jgi:hypothetical protein